MNDDEANDYRLYAAEIIRRLWEAGQTDQLKLLGIQIKASLKQPKSSDTFHND